MAKKKLIVSLVLLLLLLFVFSFARSGYASDVPQTCPDGYTCLNEEEADEIAGVIEHHNCLVSAGANEEIILEWEPIHIVATKEGQHVFGEQDFYGMMYWCDWELELRGQTLITVSKYVETKPEWGFRLRVKLGLAWLPSLIGEEGLRKSFDPVLVLEPFHWKLLHIQVHGGLQQAGISLGADLTNNLDAFGGVALPYNGEGILPVVGLSLSFN